MFKQFIFAKFVFKFGRSLSLISVRADLRRCDFSTKRNIETFNLKGLKNTKGFEQFRTQTSYYEASKIRRSKNREVPTLVL